MGSSSDDGNYTTKSAYFTTDKLRPPLPDLDSFIPNDQVSISLIVQSICGHRQWNYDDFKEDVAILDKQHIRILADLHVLRKQSFDKLEISLILKDLLFKTSMESLKHLKSPQKVDTKPVELTAENMTPANMAASFLSGKMTTTGVQVTSIQISPQNPKKLIVNANGTNYECERYCPHKNVDMVHGYVEGNNLICQKHGWAFNLANGGLCSEKNKTVHACQLQW